MCSSRNLTQLCTCLTKISHKDVMETGVKYANDFYQMDLEELQRTIYPGSIYQGRNVDTKTPELTSEAYAGVMGAIKSYMYDCSVQNFTNYQWVYKLLTSTNFNLVLLS